MKAFHAPPTIDRLTARQQLSRIRYPESRQVISEPTLWRWCNLAGIPSRLREFTESQCHRLAQVALWKRQGYNDDQISLFLGEPNHDRKQRIRPQQQDQSQSAPTSSADQWAAFFGG